MSKGGKAHLNELYKAPLPVHNVLPLPLVTLNPISIAWYLYQYLWPSISVKERLAGYLDEHTSSVWIQDEAVAARLWFSGFFGKGQFSRSEPSWYIRTQRTLGLIGKNERLTSEEVTARRRVARAQMKAERARKEKEDLETILAAERKVSSANSENKEGVAVETASLVIEAHCDSIPADTLPSTENTILRETDEVETEPIPNLENLQLTLYEALFLSTALDALDVYAVHSSQPLSSQELLQKCIELHKESSFGSCGSAEDDYSTFMVQYAVYHHYRSLGWTVRPGIKFGVDWLLYKRGPVFSHAEFSIIVLPTPRPAVETAREWWWLHCLSRVNGQVKKTVILTYVEFDLEKASAQSQSLAALLKSYKIREVSLKRWLPSRNRD